MSARWKSVVALKQHVQIVHPPSWIEDGVEGAADAEPPPRNGSSKSAISADPFRLACPGCTQQLKQSCETFPQQSPRSPGTGGIRQGSPARFQHSPGHHSFGPRPGSGPGPGPELCWYRESMPEPQDPGLGVCGPPMQRTCLSSRASELHRIRPFDESSHWSQ
jgi:hypothetical protein